MIRAGLVGPFGPVALVERDGLLVGLEWRLPEVPGRSALLDEGVAQLQAYFAGRLTRFDLPMDWGSGLNEAVRRAMADIPFGETRTYGQIAQEQIFIPLSTDPNIDRIRIERYSGSGLLIDASLYRLGGGK